MKQVQDADGIKKKYAMMGVRANPKRYVSKCPCYVHCNFLVKIRLLVMIVQIKILILYVLIPPLFVQPNIFLIPVLQRTLTALIWMILAVKPIPQSAHILLLLMVIVQILYR